tara:strand:- start:220 stop:507 length:288 start_codon:yes stop_codon:yes gene_type:complete
MSRLNKELQEAIDYGRQQGLNEAAPLYDKMARAAIRALMLIRTYGYNPNRPPSDWSPFGKPNRTDPTFQSGGGNFGPFAPPTQGIGDDVPEWWNL